MTGGLDHIKEFDKWLQALIMRHKAAVYVHYSTLMARWESQWYLEDRKRMKSK